MKDLWKTLFGDAKNVSVVALVLLMELLLVRLGYGSAAVVTVPLTTMAGVVWLAFR